MRDRLRAWGPAAAWAGVLFFLSAIPGTHVPPLLFPGEDKVAHLALYAVFGAALAWGWARSARESSATPVLALGLLYGASDEWHQAFVPGRDPSLGDLLADTAGVLLGYWLFSFVRRHLE
ncbi:MAG: VanZ family protein [Longimicrobiales bacterium]|nr:VanZ family protein [Longimicrobiales bacterium]